MTCQKCDCLDCARQNAIDAAHFAVMNNDEPVSERPAPIHRSSKVEPYNAEQARVWLEYIDEVYNNDYKGVTTIPLPNLLAMACRKIPGLRWENASDVAEQMHQLILDSTNLFEVRKGKNGGVYRKPGSVVGDHAQTTARLNQSVAVSAAVNNHTCPGCGNTKCSTDEKSCWKCGGAL